MVRQKPGQLEAAAPELESASELAPQALVVALVTHTKGVLARLALVELAQHVMAWHELTARSRTAHAMCAHVHARAMMVERSFYDVNDLVNALQLSHDDHELCNRMVNDKHVGLEAECTEVAGALANCLCQPWDDPDQTHHHSARCNHNIQD